MHGGASLSGLASPRYKTGRYSKVLPAKMLARYRTALEDPELLNLRDEIALVDARLSELLGRVESAESGAAWNEAHDQFMAVRAAIKSGSAQALKHALDGLDAAIQRSQMDYAAWGEVYDALDMRRRLVESERKRLVQLSQMITTEQAMVLMTAVVGLVQEHVQDPHALAAIAAGIRQLTSVEGDP